MNMWAIKDQNDKLLPYTVRPTRREAIDEVAGSPECLWLWLYRQGWRAVRVRVEDMTQDPRLAA